jgi:hypothetical protein
VAPANLASQQCGEVGEVVGEDHGMADTGFGQRRGGEFTVDGPSMAVLSGGGAMTTVVWYGGRWHRRLDHGAVWDLGEACRPRALKCPPCACSSGNGGHSGGSRLCGSERQMAMAQR